MWGGGEMDRKGKVAIGPPSIHCIAQLHRALIFSQGRQLTMTLPLKVLHSSGRRLSEKSVSD